MKKQFAFIGLGPFCKRILAELDEIDCEILLIDKDREAVEQYKEQADTTYIADAINEQTITRLIPPQIDAVIIDLGKRIEASILATNYLKKQGINNIIAKAETDEHGEILELIGANSVILPNREAARKITPLLLSSQLFTFLPISNGLVIAEIQPPEIYWGKTLLKANLRQVAQINVIAVRNKKKKNDFEYFAPQHVLQQEDILLIIGKENDVITFGIPVEKQILGKSFLKLFKNLLGKNSLRN